MNIQTVIPRPQALLPPVVVLRHLLLTETSSATPPADPDDITPELLTLRATQVTVVLRDILEQRGYLHGGIND